MRIEDDLTISMKPGGDLLGDTVSKSCAGIEEQIRSASSREEAQGIVDQACNAFSNQCLSEILKRALTDHVDKLLTQYWATDDNQRHPH